MEYQIRIRLDDNKDGIFQFGSYEKRKLPEKIVFHKDKINLRSNWEIEGIQINISE